MDSAALTSLVSGAGAWRSSPSPSRMRALFDVGRLEREFQVFETRAGALAAFSAMGCFRSRDGLASKRGRLPAAPNAHIRRSVA